MKQTQMKNSKPRRAKLGNPRKETPNMGVVIIDIDDQVALNGKGKDETEMEIDAMNGGDTLLTVHRIASGLFKSGAFDKATMRKFDELCLTPVAQMSADDIKALRESSGVSQAVLARILNVTASTVGQWERGEKRPTGSALKLLSLMRSNGVGAVL